MVFERTSQEAAAYKLMDLIMEHSKQLWESFSHLKEMMELYLSGKTNRRIRELAEAIKEIEKKGNEIKLQIYDYLAKIGEALMYREDWMRLILNLDSILDYVDSISFWISIATSKRWYPTPEVAEGFKQLLSSVSSMLEKLRAALSLFMSNVHKTLEACNQLEEVERAVDELHRDLGLKLLESNVSTSALMLLHEVCERLETLSDLALRTGDSLRLLAMHRAP